jgi:hypothetical protein
MPETYGKRQRKATQERKAAERDARRVARNQRREARAAGELETSWLGEPPTFEDEPREG